MSPEDGEVLLPFWQSDHIFLGQNDPPKKWMVKYCTNDDTFSGSIDTRISTRPHLLLEGLGLVLALSQNGLLRNIHMVSMRLSPTHQQRLAGGFKLFFFELFCGAAVLTVFVKHKDTTCVLLCAKL